MDVPTQPVDTAEIVRVLLDLATGDVDRDVELAGPKPERLVDLVRPVRRPHRLRRGGGARRGASEHGRRLDAAGGRRRPASGASTGRPGWSARADDRLRTGGSPSRRSTRWCCGWRAGAAAGVTPPLSGDFRPAAPVVARADAALALEGRAQRERRGVADLPGHRRDRGVGLEQQVGGEREPPAGEERHRRLAHQLGEAAGERRPRDAGPVGQVRDGPRVLGVVLHQPQRRADDGVALGGVPGGRVGLWAVEPGAEHADQQQVEEPVEHRVLARARRAPPRRRAGRRAGCRARAARRTMVRGRARSSRRVTSPSSR